MFSFAAEELEVNLESHRLTISGKRQIEETHKDKNKKMVYTERCADQVLRVVDLPAEVDISKATATLENGVLQLTMQKAAPVKNVGVETKEAWRLLRASTKGKGPATSRRLLLPNAAFG